MKLTYTTAVFYSILIAAILFLMEWAGYRGKYVVWGDPQPLTEIWWHLARSAIIAFAMLVGWKAIHRLLDRSGAPEW